MAFIAYNLTTVSRADTTTGWSGSSGQQDLEVYRGGGTTPAAYTYQTGKNGIETCTFTPATNINMTATYTTPHLYWTMRCDVFPFCEALNTGSTNSGLMIRVTDGSGNYTQWHVAGSDTWDGGWRMFVLDLTNSANTHSTSGTLSLTDVDIISFITDNSNSGNIRIIDNTWVDEVYYGEGVNITSSTTEAIDFQDLADNEATVAGWRGVTQGVDGIIFAQGGIEIGSTGTRNANLVSSNETVYFKDRIVSSSHYFIKGVANPSYAFDYDIQGLVCKTVGSTGAEFDFSDTDIDSFSMTGSTLIDMGAVSFYSGATVSGCSFTGCGTFTVPNTISTSTFKACDQITISGSGQLADCTIDSSANSTAVVVPNLNDVDSCTFVSDATGHAVQVSGTISTDTSMSWNCTLDDGAGTEWTGTAGTTVGVSGTANDAILVSVNTGITLTINVAQGATTPTVRNTGAGTVTINSGVTVTVQAVDIDGSAVNQAVYALYAANNTQLPYQESVSVSSNGTIATVSHTAHGMNTGDKVLIAGLSNTSLNGVHTITKTGTDSYTYPTSITQSSISGNATWTAIYTTAGVSEGSASLTRDFAADQPVTGWVRKSTSAPYYKSAPVSGTISSSTGLTLTALMLLDQ